MDNSREFNVLIIEDEQMIIDGYKAILTQARPENMAFKFDSANDCDSAWDKLALKKYDLVFLDLSFPIREGSKFSSGEELGKSIRGKYPEILILIITGSEETYQLGRIVEKTNPEGFLLKSETNSREITRCVETLLDGRVYQSRKISDLLRSRLISRDPLDEFDRKLLYQLSLGTKTKDLPKHIPLSLRTIEIRKRRIKDFFKAEDNEELLRRAKEKGFL